MLAGAPGGGTSLMRPQEHNKLVAVIIAARAKVPMQSSGMTFHKPDRDPACAVPKQCACSSYVCGDQLGQGLAAVAKLNVFAADCMHMQHVES